MPAVRGRAFLLVVALLAPALAAGCVDRLDQALRSPERAPAELAEPSTQAYRWTETNVTIEASDGVPLRATLFRPVPLEPTERFPVVLFVHGWGGARPSGGPMLEVLRDFARDGYSVLAYDVRGFGESGGNSTLAGEREMQDQREVIDWVVEATPWSGRLGVTGASYGGGHSWWALVNDDRVTTAVPHYGWIDLAEGLAPGGVPKTWWIATLLAVGAEGQGRYDPVIYEWAQAAYTRDDLTDVLAALRERSVVDRLGNVTKPVFIVEGTRETLFPQALEAYAALDDAEARKVFLYEGGHGSFDQGAWDLTHSWFDRWLKLEDTGVEEWPELVMPALDGAGQDAFETYPLEGTMLVEYRLVDETPLDGEGALATDANGSQEARARFTGTARSGIFDDPSVLHDQSGARGAPAPTRLRALPNEVMLFRSAALVEDALLVGEPLLNLTLAPATPLGSQVAARLYAEAPDGTARLLSRGGYDPTYTGGAGSYEFEMSQALARVAAGERLVLLVAGDDATYTGAYPRPFTSELVFGGDTGARLVVPLAPAGA